MLEAEVANYLREIKRVLKTDGKCFATCFLLNAESEQFIAAGRSKLNIIHPIGHAKTVNALVPSDVGYPETFMRNMLENTGLSLLSTHYGSWCGRDQFLSYQDILILEPAPRS
jgi:hypothetical protein